MRIGIFGGCFNPPHNMHIEICNKLLENNYLDKIIIVPTGNKYEYKHNLLNDNIRYNLLSILINKYKNIELSNYELQEREVFTYETLDHYKSKYKDALIYFICGADNLSYIDEWCMGYYILSNYKIIVISRSTDNLEEILEKYQEYKDNIIIANISEKNISSTEIRHLLRKNNYEEAKKYLDIDVLNYIKINNLYK
jgi:nicotinate-nucleotide adenylyltransferase